MKGFSQPTQSSVSVFSDGDIFVSVVLFFYN